MAGEYALERLSQFPKVIVYRRNDDGDIDGREGWFDGYGNRSVEPMADRMDNGTKISMDPGVSS